NGNANTKYGDNYWINTTTGKRITLFGGSLSTGSNAGFSSFTLAYSSTNSHNAVGSRLLKTAL
ncbi:MAG: hypothetical protein RSE21_04460, partial [Bacilli bacterium]